MSLSRPNQTMELTTARSAFTLSMAKLAVTSGNARARQW